MSAALALHKRYPANKKYLLGKQGVATEFKTPNDFPSLRGTASGVSISFRFLGATLSPVVTGYLADTFSLTAGYGSAAILLAAGAVISIFTIKEPSSTPVEAGLDRGNPHEIT